MDKKNDFLLEKHLEKLDKELSKRFSSAVFAMPYVLSKYKKVFPYFTDHTIAHSMNVIEFCNKIIGEQINKMNADEAYVILLAAYLHDTGMGISMKDYQEFAPYIDYGDYFTNHSKDDVPNIIRAFHNEFSGLYIKKYANFFEFPSKEHLHAIVQIARGHRKTDLEDEKEYPIDFKVPNGNTICLPYLSALVRLADEIDVTASRNLLLDITMEELTSEHDILEFGRHEVVKALEVNEKEFVMVVDTKNDKMLEEVNHLKEKMQHTLDVCRHAVNGVTPFEIKQESIIIKKIA